jgi:hypothetical protein
MSRVDFTPGCFKIQALSMSETYPARNAFLKMVVFLMAFLIVTGWALSWFWTLKWDWFFGLLGLGAALWLAFRWSGSRKRLLAGLAEPLAWWPFLLLLSLIAAGGLIYPPTMLDSLSYRLPRIFAWMQEGHIQFVPTANDRMNYMPHSWSLCLLPILQLSGSDLLEFFWSSVSWIILSLVAYDWAFELNGDRGRARQMAFIAAASTFAVLQAESSANDLFAVVLLLLSLRFVMEFERTRNWREIIWAVLSFCLAAGTKPQFAVFGLPLAIWFFASPAKPWRAFRWVWTPVLLVLWLICSPAPSFLMNFNSYGSITGPGLNDSMTGKRPQWNYLLGTTMIVWQSLQPPVSPFGMLNKQMDRAVENSGLKKEVPKFNLRVAAVAMVDSAPLGLVASVMFVCGIYVAARRRLVSRWSWRSLAFTAGLLGLMLAMGEIVSENSGRAFCGFLYFGLPLAMAGWNWLSPGRLKLGFYFSLLSALTALVLTPGRPLWPARFAHEHLIASEKFRKLNDVLEPYFKYSERAQTAREIIAAVPQSEREFAVLVGDDRPLLPMFRPYNTGRKVDFLPRDARPEDLKQLNVNYVIVGGGAEEFYPQLCAYLKQGGDFHVETNHDYTSKLTRGAETWILYHRNSPVPVAPAP